jgi:hypothetical protein
METGGKLVGNTMAMAPFSPRLGSPEGESRRARLALLIAAVGIAAILLVYAISPGVRHAVRHVAHTVKHDVSRVFDHDVDHKGSKHAPPRPAAVPPAKPSARHPATAPVRPPSGSQATSGSG